MTRHELETMSRKELVNWLEGARSIACYKEESTALLRECALEDYDNCAVEEGFAESCFFRHLNADEEATFRDWARLNFDPTKKVDASWHPVVRDEWNKLQQSHK
jgi:hypothetical protein